jgi:hypothetical protein
LLSLKFLSIPCTFPVQPLPAQEKKISVSDSDWIWYESYPIHNFPYAVLDPDANPNPKRKVDADPDQALSLL